MGQGFKGAGPWARAGPMGQGQAHSHWFKLLNRRAYDHKPSADATTRQIRPRQHK